MLLWLPESESDCKSDRATVVWTQTIKSPLSDVQFDSQGLRAGTYCAMIRSTTQNFTSAFSVQIKDKGIAESCSDWNATIVLTASYSRSTVDVDMEVTQHPGCDSYRVGLWEQLQVPGGQPCIHNIVPVEEERINLTGSSGKVSFENVTAGNYCVRVTPVCPGTSDCVTLYSKVVDMPEVVRLPREGVQKPSSSIIYLAVVVPVVFIVALSLAALMSIWLRGRKWAGRAHGVVSLAVLGPTVNKGTAPTGGPGQSPLVVKVVYSRDSEQHNNVVAQLCALLQIGLEVEVVYDENACALAHMSNDWAIGMAHVRCPRFYANQDEWDQQDGNSRKHREEKLLFIESEGALIKQEAYHNNKDVGLTSETYTDDLYHTTYAALLSRHAQALGDYCHIAVARFCYTTSPSRLDLVPEKRYTLPQHMQELMEALLHGCFPAGIAQERARKACDSEAYQCFMDALNNARNTLEENPELVRDRLKAIVVT